MILLLDAHALLWWLSDDATLADAARQSIADPLVLGTLGRRPFSGRIP